MYAPSSNHRLSHLPKILFRTLLLLVPPVLLVTFIVLYLGAHGSSRQPAQSQALSQSETTQPANWQQSPLVETPIPAGSRPVFPFSIVPGGVRNAKELQAASSSDPVVARHYSDFKLANARSIRLDHPVAMYVSYRRENRVFWTRNRMVVPAGETLLTDGENLARTRCGNRLSPVAAKPVAAMDPTVEELEQPSFVPPLLAGLLPGGEISSFGGSPPATPPGTPTGPIGSTSGGSVTPPVLPPILLPGGPPPVTPNTPVIPPPPVNTAEPGSLALLLAGFVLLLSLVSFARRR